MVLNNSELKSAYFKFVLLGTLLLMLDRFSDLSVCIFYNYIGIPCPSCGITRAFASFINLDFRQAFWYHPLFFTVIFFPYLYVKNNNKLFIITAFLFMTVWIIRLYVYFPYMPPMAVNQSAVLYSLLR